MSSENLRLFVAFALSSDVAHRLGEIIADLRPHSRLSGGRNSVKWVDADKIHLTIKFLGATPSEKVSSIVETINRPLQNDETKDKPLIFAIERVGAFPNLNRPRVLWVNLDGDPQRLRNFVNKIEEALELIGFPKEKRSFKPHLTLGRVREREDVSALARILESYKIETIPVTLDRVILFKSDLRPTGPIYTPLNEWKV
ncbi:MAG: RNA 2',3'-cyclic phosphodiesterase [candidate division Zixibacteria bacterium]|nr:RNA 2',3'-cyclic phosphodiesterase [candidate division Zixibacteria bacterium]